VVRLVNALSRLLGPDFSLSTMGPQTVTAGENILTSILSQISASSALIVIVSDKAASNRWVQSEIAWALGQKEGRLPIVPVLRTDPDLMPHLLRDRAYLDFSKDEKFEENAAKLARAIVSLIEKPRPQPNFGDEMVFLNSQRAVLEELKQYENKMLARRQAFIVTATGGMAIVALFSLVISLLASLYIDTLWSFVLPVLTALSGYVFGSSRWLAVNSNTIGSRITSTDEANSQSPR
jgi:TIR domain